MYKPELASCRNRVVWEVRLLIDPLARTRRIPRLTNRRYAQRNLLHFYVVAFVIHRL